VKLQTLQPRVARVNTLRVQPLSTMTQRMTGRRLQERNRNWLTAHPLCVHCKAKGIVRSAREVDHIVPLHQGGRDDETNLQGLCVECHKAKSAQEAADRQGGGSTLASRGSESALAATRGFFPSFKQDSNGGRQG